MSAAFSAGVIGCGRMGAFTSPSLREYGPACFLPSAHAEALSMADGIDLVSLCDADAAALARAGAAYQVENRHGSIAELLAKGAPDLVCLATRTPGRADMILDCIAAGARALHVEKPLCNSRAELARLETVLARKDIFMTLGAVRRHIRVYREALKEAGSGAYGKLLAAYGEFGSRTLYWSHPHTVDLLLFAAGGKRIEAVQARLGPLDRRGARISNDPLVLDANIWFEGGFSGHITRIPGTDWRLACESAQLAVVANGSSLWRSGRPAAGSDDNPYHEPERLAGPQQKTPEGTLAPLSQLVACLGGDSDAIAANAEIKRDIINGQKVLFALVQSHLEGGHAVTLEDVDPALVIEGCTKGAPA